MPEESYSKYMLKGTSTAFIIGIVIGALGLLLRMFLSRSLSPADYGIFYAVFSLVGLLSLLRGLGLGSAIIKFLPEFEEKEDFTSLKSSIVVVLLVRLAVVLVVAGILFIFSEEIAVGFIGSKSAAPIIQLLSIWFVSMLFVKTAAKVFHAFKDILGFKSVELARIIITFGILAAFSYFMDLEAREVAISFILGSILTSIWIIIRLRKHESKLSKGKIQISKGITKKILYFGLPLLLAGLAGAVTSRIDTLVITAFMTPEDVGFYQVARPATRIITQMAVIGVPLFPMVSELWAKRDKKKLNLTIYYISKFSFLLMIPAALIFLVFPKIVIRILFTSKFLPATEAVRILALTMVVTNVFNILGKILVATGKNILRAKLYVLAMVLNVVGDIILVPISGIEGAAIAFLSSFSIALLLEFYFLRKHIEFHFPGLDIGKIIIGGIITVLLIFLLKNILIFNWLLELILLLAVGGLFYVIWISRTRVLAERDLRIMKENIPIPDPILKILRKFVKYERLSK